MHEQEVTCLGTPDELTFQIVSPFLSVSSDCFQQPRKWGGADAGSSGAMAFLDEGGNWEVQLVSTTWQRGHRRRIDRRWCDVLMIVVD